MRYWTHTLSLAALAAVLFAGCDAASDAGPAAADASGGNGNGNGGSTSGTVFATSNPAGAANDAIVRLSSALDLQATYNGFDAAVTSVQNITFASNGAAFVTVDLGSAAAPVGGILVVDRLCGNGRNGCSGAGGAVGGGSRLIAGPATGLTAPKGLILARGSLIVADNGLTAAGGPGTIRVYDRDATGDAAPRFVVTNITGTNNVWDVDYDQRNDRLFVAGTNGVVLVYDRFFRDRGVSGPSRTITPSDAAGVKVSVNLHGIDFDERTRTLVLSDVGVANGMPPSATDGQLFTIADGDTASGNVQPRYRLLGAASRLGNPVDLVLDGRDALVAEKANSLVLRFTDILARTGTTDAAAEDSAPVANAESVALPGGDNGNGGNGNGHGGGRD